MKRAEVLDTARDAVLRDRASAHGKPEETFQRIAMLWSAYLDARIAPSDVAHMMVLLKVARARGNPTYADNHVDMAGYAACAAELVAGVKPTLVWEPAPASIHVPINPDDFKP